MMSIKPFVLATLPIYFVFAGMLLTAAVTYELEVALLGPFTPGNPGFGGVLFFLVFTFGFLAEVYALSHLKKLRSLQDIRVKLPRTWRSVILDVISWSNTHRWSEPALVLGGVLAFGAISEAVFYTLMAAHVPVFVLFGLGLAGLFPALFVAASCQVLVQSTIRPVGYVSDEEFAEIYEKALDKLTDSDIELLKKDATFEPSPKVRRYAMSLFSVALVALPVAMGLSYEHMMHLALPLSYVGGAAAIVGILVMALPISGRKVSELSRRLQGTTEENQEE